ncbi:MAG: PAS domain S-box protein [Spirochaetes bacterium]|nr:PAS domain S-box protein [Spirochaetota bacterium]
MEDEVLIALSEKMTLEKYGYSVITATTGEKAVEAVNKALDIDLILMDINLGKGIDGTQAAELILKDHDIPIVFASNHSEREVVEKTEKITSYGYVVKSSSITVLDASIKMAFKLFDEKEKSKFVNNKLEATLDALPDLLFEIDLDGTYFDVHAPHTELLYKPLTDSWIGKNIYDVLPSEATEIIMSAVKEANEKEYSIGKQYELSVPLGKRWFEISVSRMVSDISKRHFIYLSRDITDRKKAADELRENEEKYRLLHENAGIGIGYFSLDGIVLSYNNLAAKHMNGVPEDFIGKSIYEIFPKSGADSYHDRIKKAALSTIPVVYDDMVPLPSGNKYFLSTFTRIADITGKIFGIQIISQETTEIKQIESKLRESKEMAEMLLNVAAEIILSFDDKGIITLLNESGHRILGYDAPELIGKNWFDTCLPEERRKATRQFVGTLMNGENHGIEANFNEVITKTGERKTIYWHNAILENKDGTIVGLFSSGEDITERKKAEEALRESEVRFRMLFNSGRDAIAVHLMGQDGQPTNFIQVNDVACERLGYTKEEMLKLSPQDIDSPDRSGQMPDIIEKLLKNKQVLFETEHLSKDGHRIPVEVSTVLFQLDDNQVTMSVARDITERKKADDLLKREKERLHNVLIGTNAGTWEWNIQTGEYSVDCISAEILGYSLNELQPVSFEAWMGLKHPDDRANTNEFLMKHMRGETEFYSFESRMRHKNGNWVWIHGRGKVIEWDKDRKPLRMFGTHTDITERKVAEEALRESEARQRSLFENAPIGIFYSTVEGKIIHVNAEYARIMGYSSAEELKRVVNQSSASEAFFDRPSERDKLVNDAWRTLGSWIGTEQEYRRRDGTHITANLLIRALPENPSFLEGFVEDITERTCAEDALRESEAKYRGLIEKSRDGIVTTDENGIITTWNMSMESITGLPRTDTIGRPLWEIQLQLTPAERATPELGEQLRKDLRTILESRMDWSGETRSAEIQCSDGKRKLVHDSSLIIKIGAKIFLESIITDITERKLSEQKIMSLLAEKDLILKEVHHRIKNNMSTINSLLSIQAGTLKDPSAVEALKDAGSRVQSMMVLYDKLFQSASFNDISLEKYLPALMDEIVANFPNSTSVRIEKRIQDFVLDAKRLQLLGIIINELLTNIMKYAFTGRDEGLIAVSATIADSHVSIIIQDNGNGMPGSVSFENSAGFGLMLVKMLTEQLEGKIRIERGHGTKVVLEFEI